MATRPVPKLSGLIKTGAVVPASEEVAAGAPDFSFLDEPRTGEPQSDSKQSQAPALVGNANAGDNHVSRGGVLIVPLHKLRPSPYNSRKIRPTARIEEVAEMLRKEGQLNELHVYAGTGKDAGLYFIIGGVTRFLAAPLAGINELRVKLVDADPQNAAALIQVSRQLNDTLEQSDIDDALLAKQLADEGHTQDQIAEMLGFKSRASIHRLNAYFDLPESIMENGKAYPKIFSASLAAILLNAFKAHGEVFAESLLQKALLPEPDTPSHATLIALINSQSRKAARDDEQRKRKRLESSIELKIAGTSVGSMAIHKSANGKKSIALNVECDGKEIDNLAAKLKDVIVAMSS